MQIGKIQAHRQAATERGISTLLHTVDNLSIVLHIRLMIGGGVGSDVVDINSKFIFFKQKLRPIFLFFYLGIDSTFRSP